MGCQWGWQHQGSVREITSAAQSLDRRGFKKTMHWSRESMLTAHEERAPVHQFSVDFFLSPPTFIPSKLLKHYSFLLYSQVSHTNTHTPADCGRQHQSVMEGGTSLAGEDRGEGGWNHLGDAVERELLRLSGWGERGWRERERRGGMMEGRKRRAKEYKWQEKEKVNMSEKDNERR